MNYSCYLFRRKLLIAAVFLALPAIALAESSATDLQEQIDNLQNQVTALNSEVQQAAEWKNPNTLVHMAGFAAVGFIRPENGKNSFTVGTFSPIFHFQYRDVVMLESELEITTLADGGTDVTMEYLTLDWFVSDYTAIIAGKFLSPVGQFRQNLHPSWVNKMPSAPPGFGHDGAAPVSELGVHVRGGFPLGTMRATYSVYASNGPELKAETDDESEFGLDGVAAEAFGMDRDGKKSYGGRFSVLPVSSIEIGVSYATGKAAVTVLEANGVATPGPGLEPGATFTGEADRDYDVRGADFVWFSGNMSLRGEYVKTEIGDATTGITAGDGATWKAWYSQLAYRLPNTKWEGVVRYTDFDSPHASQDVKQTMLGVNYLVSNNFIAKLAYESNVGLTGAPSDNDRTLLQLAYGF